MRDLSTYSTTDLSLTAGERRRARSQTAGPLWFDAVLRPHRSLGSRDFRTLMGAVAGVSVLAAMRASALGAWPVAVIFLLDAALLYGAFRLSYLSARGFETLQLTRRALILTRVCRRGRASSHAFDPGRVRVRLVGETPALADLVLEEGGRYVKVGRDLPPTERADIAEALARALDARRAGAPPLRAYAASMSSSE